MLDTIVLFREALYGALVIGLACSVLGLWVVLRRIVFVGAALAQLSSAGIALALWAGGFALLAPLAHHPTIVSLAVTLLGALFFGLGGGRRLVSGEAAIGATYAIAAALGILLISKAVTGEAHDIFLQGNILGITRGDTLVLLAVAVPVLAIHAIFYKEFLFVSFDPETARTLGYAVTRWNLLLYFTLGVVIASAMQFAGVLLVFGMLVLPAVTGLLLASSMRGAITGAVVSALLAVTLGFAVSVPFDLPSAPAILAVAGLLLGLAWGYRRLRG
ncbi:MAG: metal ABC transporter permease [Gemmatimonadales bacterium]